MSGGVAVAAFIAALFVLLGVFYWDRIRRALGFRDPPVPVPTVPPPPPTSSSSSTTATTKMILATTTSSSSKQPQTTTTPGTAPPTSATTSRIPLPVPRPYDEIRTAIERLIEDPTYIDRNFAPLFLRMSWHSAGTWHPNQPIRGGPCPGTIRFPEELNRRANRGLGFAAARLEPVKRAFPFLSYADLYTLCGVVGIRYMRGPDVPWQPGRIDQGPEAVPPDGRLPDDQQGAAHINQVFGRMGFTKQEAVALLGAHTTGRIHAERSVVDGQWSQDTLRFDNAFFRNLVGMQWLPRVTPEGLRFFISSDNLFTMLVSDMALLDDPEMALWVRTYAADNARFMRDFSAAFAQLITLGGCPFAGPGKMSLKK